jgi:predicted PurR-regulated permease PerM
MTDERAARRLIAWAVAVALGSLVLLWTLYLLRDVVLLVYLSAMVAFGFSPMVRWIERHPWRVKHGRRVPRSIAILAVYAAVLAFVTLVLAVVLPPFISQARDLWAQTPDYLTRGQRWLVAHSFLKRALTMPELIAQGPTTDVALSSALNALEKLVGGVVGFSTMLVLSYYMLVEATDLRNAVVRFFPESRRAQVLRFIDAVSVKVGAWLGGQFMLGSAIGATAALGFWLIGIPYFYVLALICGLGELIPVIGPILAAVPALAVAASVGMNKLVLVGSYLAIQQFTENHFVIPKLMQRRVGVSAMTVVVALLAGGSLLGMVGALLAVPSAAILQLLLQEYLERRDTIQP